MYSVVHVPCCQVFMNTVRKRPHELKRPIAVRYWFTYENEGTEDQTGTGREPDVREEEVSKQCISPQLS